MPPQDFWSVYHGKLYFLKTVNPDDIHVRTTTEVRTHQVAGAMLFGIDPTTGMSRRPWPVYTQPEGVSNSHLCVNVPSNLSIRSTL
jgi:2-phosphoxylose phosphatase